MVLFLLAMASLAAGGASGLRAADKPDGTVKSWITAEMYGAMKWGRGQADSSKERLEFATAERICRERLDSQVKAGSLTRASALVISEKVRKEGVYRGDKLTAARAHEIRRSIISGKIFQGLRD